MGKKHYAGAILAILIALAACGGEYTPNEAEAEIIRNLERGNKISPIIKDTSVVDTVKFSTKFIELPDGKIIKEKKNFTLYKEVILIDKDTVFLDNPSMGYIVIKFPYNQIKKLPIFLGEGYIKVGEVKYLERLRNDVVNSYIIVKGDTKKVLLSKGVPSHKIPKIPQVGNTITW